LVKLVGSIVGGSELLLVLSEEDCIFSTIAY